MRSLVIFVLTTSFVSGLREEGPGFAVDYRSFSGSPHYQEQHLPHRDQARSFRESSTSLGQLQPFRDDSLRDYRQPFPNHEDPRLFRDENGFSEGRPPSTDDSRGFRDEIRPFRDDHRQIRDGPRHFRDDRPYRAEQRPFREESRPYRAEPRPFRDDLRLIRDEANPYEAPRTFRDEIRPFREDPRPFSEEQRQFRDSRPFRDESGLFRNEPRPFREESGPLRNEPRPFRDDPRPFKDELLFTQESRSLADAQHQFNKEQRHEEHQIRQPLSFGGHSNYLKFGNHGLGFASIPPAILPLEENTSRLSPGMMSGKSTLSPNDSTKNQISVTLAPEIGSTPNSASSNTIDGHNVSNVGKNENLVGGSSARPVSTAVTISNSDGMNVTPKVIFGSGTTSIADSTTVGSGLGMQSAIIPSANSLHSSKPSMQVVADTAAYYPKDGTSEVSQALLNYVFKYQLPEDTKTRYTFRQTLPAETYNRIQTLPLVPQHQTTKYILPEFKISGLSGIQQPAGTINYLQPLSLGTSYSRESRPMVNFAQNLIPLGDAGQFTNFGLGDSGLRQFGQLGHQLGSVGQLEQLGQYSPLGQLGQLGQSEQGGNFNQGGVQLQLGGYAGIDYSALSSNSEAKVGLSLSEAPRPPAPTFAKISFGDSIWQ